MRKKVAGSKLSRSRTARDALYRSLLKALVEHGRIKTTQAKAKAVKPQVDKIFSKAKKGDLSARRRVLAQLANDKKLTNEIFKIAKKFKRTSGFTRVIKLPARKGDNARLAIIEFVEKFEEAAKTKGDEKETKATKKSRATKEKESKTKGTKTSKNK
jgi:large subunit ribosomal protein L17